LYLFAINACSDTGFGAADGDTVDGGAVEGGTVVGAAVVG
jgi:hypothetical protein